MAKGMNQKLKQLYLVKIFTEETDDQHGLTLPEREVLCVFNDWGEEDGAPYPMHLPEEVRVKNVRGAERTELCQNPARMPDTRFERG